MEKKYLGLFLQGRLKISIFLMVLFTNVWIWKILFLNWVLAVGLIHCCLILYYGVFKNKKFLYIFIILFFGLLIYQIKTTEFISLTNLDNDQIRLRDQRIKEYPPVYIQLFNKALWIKSADFLENDKMTVLSRVQANLFDNLDFNQYFFASAPRPRIDIKEFEKFPYFYLPFFIAGVYLLVKEKKKIFLIFLIPLFILSFFGNKNTYGPFIFFPFFTLTIFKGMERFISFMSAKFIRRKYLIYTLLLVLGLAVFVQGLIYEFI